MNTKKRAEDFVLVHKEILSSNFTRLDLLSSTELPLIEAGQFVQVQIPSSLYGWLRIPISIHDVRAKERILSLLVQKVGDGSIQLSSCPENSKINLIYPLGKGFTMPNLELASLDTSILLVGGGCGIAPLLYLAKNLKENGIKTSVLLGARSRDQLICQETLSSYASLYPCTEDGSVGFKGLVTEHPLWKTESFSHIYTCGPTPMMKAVAALSVKMGSKHCQVSLENTMACGLGACLCCVTPSAQGHNLCVCTDGPVFDASVLGW